MGFTSALQGSLLYGQIYRILKKFLFRNLKSICFITQHRVVTVQLVKKKLFEIIYCNIQILCMLFERYCRTIKTTFYFEITY